MPLDPQIALAGRPVQIDPPNYPETYRTLAQMRYLAAEAAGAQAKADLTRTQGAEALATLGERTRARAVLAGQEPGGAGLPLTSLSGGALLPQAAPAQPGGAPSPPPAAPGGPAAAPAAAAPLVQRLLQHGGFAGLDLVKGLVEAEAKHLENGAKQLDLVKTRMGLVGQYLGSGVVQDQAGWDLALDLIRQQGGNVEGLPKAFRPQVAAQLAQINRTEQQRVEQAQKDMQLKIDQQKATSEAVLAQAAHTTAGHKQAQPTATGFGTFDPVTGTWTKATTPVPSGGQEPVTAPAQAQRAQELNSGWMQSQQNQLFLQTKQAVTDLQAAAQLGTGAGDMAVASAYHRVMAPGTGGAPGKVEDMAQLGTLSQQAQRELQKLFTSGTLLSPTVRQEIVSVAQKTYANRVAEHQLMRKHMLGMAHDLGVSNPETVIPDLSTAAQGASGSRTITRAQVQALATKHQKSLPEMEAIIRQAGDTIVP